MVYCFYTRPCFPASLGFQGSGCFFRHRLDSSHSQWILEMENPLHICVCLKTGESPNLARFLLIYLCNHPKKATRPNNGIRPARSSGIDCKTWRRCTHLPWRHNTCPKIEGASRPTSVQGSYSLVGAYIRGTPKSHPKKAALWCNPPNLADEVETLSLDGNPKRWLSIPNPRDPQSPQVIDHGWYLPLQGIDTQNGNPYNKRRCTYTCEHLFSTHK